MHFTQELHIVCCVRPEKRKQLTRLIKFLCSSSMYVLRELYCEKALDTKLY